MTSATVDTTGTAVQPRSFWSFGDNLPWWGYLCTGVA